MSKDIQGASEKSDRATRASTEPASGLGHSAGIPSAVELDNRHNVLARFPAKVRQRIAGLCYSKHQTGRRGPCVERGLACLQCQDEAVSEAVCHVQSGSVHESAVHEVDAPHD